MGIATLEFYVDGVLTDPTSVVLSDPTATYGVRRTDNNAVIVAAGTAMTKQSTGIYTYQWNDPAAGLTYEYYVKAVYNGAALYKQKFSYATFAGSGGYAISDLRTLTRQFVRQAADSTMYSDVQVDNALQLAGDEWMRLTNASRILGTMNMTAGSSTLGQVPAGWAPEYHMQAFLTLNGTMINPTVHFVNYQDVLTYQAQYNCQNITSGVPRYFGFGDGGFTNVFTPTLAQVTPTPDQAYTLNLWYWQKFTSWTPGGTCNSFNLPNEHLRIIATDGAEAFMQANEPDNGVRAANAMKRFTDKAMEIRNRNAGGRSGTVTYKDTPCRWGAWQQGYEGQPIVRGW